MASYRIEWKPSAAKELKRLPRDVIPRIVAAVEALADFAWAENGRGDIIVNNAGLGGPRGGILNTDLAEARALYARRRARPKQ